MSAGIACFGEAVLRLGPPPGEMLLGSARLETWLGGAEVNVAAALAALGHRSRVVTALPSGPLGDAAIQALRGYGIDTGTCQRRTGRLGAYYLLHATPVTGPQVVYDREGSAFATTSASEWDWSRLLDQCDWLHLSGVTPALGPEPAAAALAAVTYARQAGLTVSFDGNWRGRLWERWHGDPPAILSAIVEQADVLFGNHKDAALLLGRSFDGDGPDRRREAALALLERMPSLKLIASTARTVLDPQHHTIVARLDTREEAIQTGEAAITPIVDRIGTGDAFAAGVIDGLRNGASHEAAVHGGLALAGIKHGIKGDCALVPRAMLDAASFEAADVAR
jgi:2-dehydro-3-deoxygluconokinase